MMAHSFDSTVRVDDTATTASGRANLPDSFRAGETSSREHCRTLSNQRKKGIVVSRTSCSALLIQKFSLEKLRFTSARQSSLCPLTLRYRSSGAVVFPSSHPSKISKNNASDLRSVQPVSNFKVRSSSLPSHGRGDGLGMAFQWLRPACQRNARPQQDSCGRKVLCIAIATIVT